jgi:hypothetical protein
MSSSHTSATERPRGVGGALFAGVLLIIGGTFWMLEGFAAVVKHNAVIFNNPDNYFNISATTWGWLHMLLGLLVFLAGFAVMAGQTWARVTGIILASVSAVVNFFYIPWYPLWAIVIIAIDIWIIHALWVYDPELT